MHDCVSAALMGANDKQGEQKQISQEHGGSFAAERGDGKTEQSKDSKISSHRDSGPVNVLIYKLNFSQRVRKTKETKTEIER